MKDAKIVEVKLGVKLSALLVHLIRLRCFIILSLLEARLVSITLCLSGLLWRDNLTVLVFVHNEQCLRNFKVLSFD